ncbi:MAG TPA: ABC-F family ATP-binding cassette domain-containing protein [Leptospiraceae bacterium]|nr:ABC-F family ATP-binding cassette domain-containing protein [Leptospiraceae bacterium]HMW05039.1 ABC-F family ATP-binding cassette domain-containing protein [Leptospiraceae bacterium]HMX31483.1 ABC-F family ATP-binding cassette domain-containing protein [Leptospiraceae bacterium]HMY33593.1 ABC-F family ATP-binding cassette domain-containing protein [Leptospiraceae bacterium]HMZ62592.1 ABC-F family ATP-binding cassette domain-containing protein [Leptospiraceae bacterium]
MIQFINIRHQYGANVLYDGFSWHIKPNTKIGLVGPNGVGKTTLFQMAVGLLKPDEGEIVRAKDTVISLFHQIPDFNGEKSVIETALTSNTLYKKYLERKEEIDKRFETTDHESDAFEKLLSDQAELEEYAHTHDLHNLEVKAKKILSGLGFKDDAYLRQVKNFSPGYHHRIGLAIALLNPYNLLLLDEPTNHLDDAAKEWLRDFLQTIKTTFVIVTHDPEFLNEVTDTIAEISLKGVIEFKGTLEAFLEEKNELHEKLKNQYRKEEAYLKKRMEWIDRFRAQATKARQVQSAIKKLEKRDAVENPEEIFWNKKPAYRFNHIPDGKITFRLENASFQYDKDGRVIFKNADLEVSAGEKIALVGPNGAGKSTLMRAILGRHTLSSGSIYFGPKTRIAYFSQTHGEDLYPELNMIQSILKVYPDMSDEAVRTILGHFSFSGDTVYKQVSAMSGGEQSRLRLALMVLTPANCLFMDEPTNHLDMVTRNALKHALMEFPGSLFIISHDPDFLKGLCNRTFELSAGVLKNLNCSFEDYLKFHKEGVYGEEDQSVKPVKTKETNASRNNDKNRIKKIQKEINDIESRLELLERNKKHLEEVLSDPAFFKNRSYQNELDNYNDTKKEIAFLTERWEILSEEIN